jgi:hypothetical protein
MSLLLLACCKGLPVSHVLTPQASFPAGSTRDFSAISQGMAQCASQETSLLLVSGWCDTPNLEVGMGHDAVPCCLLYDRLLETLTGRSCPARALLLVPAT